ncbi:MAG TPA: 2-succinyl-6-hydroxy-2,4-cyclohexadiene-1-carboxylate synthase [Solirubrobacteraceae bacterium]|nr:2-succinyl-6-hydroxy-2,4-cyclohexadiene-1-carboxylate synthase [Solirubrobacteraceae bacterium]
MHGFSGTRHAWDEVIARLDRERYRPLAVDLPGHGDATDVEGPITFEKCVDAVLAQAPERFALCGYSMGGRIALHVALAAPERVSRLALVSSSPGIEDDAERAARRAADRALADELEQVPYEDFVERWRGQPLFADEPAAVGERAREDQRRNEPSSLAAALRGIGTGEMVALWSRLGQLTMPVTVIVGERDAKFRAIGERMAKLLADVSLLVVPGGHALALESPDRLVCALERSIDEVHN